MLNNSSIHQAPFAMDTSQKILDSSLTANSRVFILDTFRCLSICHETRFSINRVYAISRQNLSLHLPKPLSLTPNLFPTHYLVSRSSFFSGIMLSYSLIMHFISFNLTFGIFETFWEFFKIVEVFDKVLGWVLFK